MNEKERKKLLGEEIMAKLKSEQIFSDRSSIAPKDKKEAIKKRLCFKIKRLRNERKNESVEALAKEWNVSRTTLLAILNYNIEKITIDICVDILELNSSKNNEANEALIRMAVA